MSLNPITLKWFNLTFQQFLATTSLFPMLKGDIYMATF